MFKAVRHVAEMAGSAATRRSRLRHDTGALRELESDALALPEGLELEWLGVSGYGLTHEGKTLYIDPFVSRAPLSYLVRRTPALPDSDQIEHFFPPGQDVVGVLV